jgi:ABC-2 type transport system ATP-binding protein
LSDDKNVIITKALTKTYGKARGIEHVDLCVKEGEFFGFMGPNGAGKSTTIRVLLGLLPRSDGQAYVFGLDSWADKVSILKRIGYLPSESSYYPRMKVKDILRLSEKLRGINCKKSREELCERLQLDPDRRVEELSFGNRKKVGIVAALQHQPELLILDEPTSGLDPLMQKVFFDILCERNAVGTTVFMSSHVLSEVQNYCQRGAIIKQGSIIASGNLDEWKKSGIRKVNFRGNADVQSLPDVKNLTVIGTQTSFLYDGDVQTLLRILASGNVSDVTIQEPDLEEIFLHYYEEV